MVPVLIVPVLMVLVRVGLMVPAKAVPMAPVLVGLPVPMAPVLVGLTVPVLAGRTVRGRRRGRRSVPAGPTGG
jgi:hypothetical protein